MNATPADTGDHQDNEAHAHNTSAAASFGVSSTTSDAHLTNPTAPTDAVPTDATPVDDQATTDAASTGAAAATSTDDASSGTEVLPSVEAPKAAGESAADMDATDSDATTMDSAEMDAPESDSAAMDSVAMDSVEDLSLDDAPSGAEVPPSSVGAAAASAAGESTTSLPARRSSYEAEGEGVQEEITGFRLSLPNFEGPFDLLLHLISSKKLDVTDVALAEVTDDFIAYTKGLRGGSNLDEITEFIVIAATLLDLKTIRLLPRREGEQLEDLELLETRDLLFARLLQYRAYREVAQMMDTWQREAAHRYPRSVSLEPQFRDMLPPVVLGVSLSEFAEIAAHTFRPRAPEAVATGHVHQVPVSVPQQAGIVLSLLRAAGAAGWLTFESLTESAENSLEIVGRFLALLELYKAQAIEVEQEESLAELRVSWTGRDVDPAVVAAANWD